MFAFCRLHQNLAPIFTTLQRIIPRGSRVEALIKFIVEQFDCSWQVIWSCLLHGIPMFSSVTAVVDAALVLLGNIISYGHSSEVLLGACLY
ncbi:serine/threonine-protein kinase ATM-like [Quercus lobata]|uniref:serine/threonine-protein kinase ATM-like n=1 Tax=Quercus lobata TaxID=97700 RepID=UPI001246C876|nr:serine/threonine-protein kinase ATM-like [Quercus lobata]